MNITTDIKRACRSYQGRHFASRWVRRIFEESSRARKLVGYQLTAVAFAVGVIEPSAHTFVGRAQLQDVAVPPVAEEILAITESSAPQWPVSHARVTQGYSSGHRALDIQDSTGNRSIYPVADGVVSEVVYSNWGYGNYVRIVHPGEMSSLYAHFSDIHVQPYQQVSKETVLGTMGRTGWATGIHLHLEVSHRNTTLNPHTVLSAE